MFKFFRTSVETTLGTSLYYLLSVLPHLKFTRLSTGFHRHTPQVQLTYESFCRITVTGTLLPENNRRKLLLMYFLSELKKGTDLHHWTLDSSRSLICQYRLDQSGFLLRSKKRDFRTINTTLLTYIVIVLRPSEILRTWRPGLRVLRPPVFANWRSRLYQCIQNKYSGQQV